MGSGYPNFCRSSGPKCLIFSCLRFVGIGARGSSSGPASGPVGVVAVVVAFGERDWLACGAVPLYYFPEETTIYRLVSLLRCLLLLRQGFARCFPLHANDLPPDHRLSRPQEPPMPAALSRAVFKICHGKNLVYNTCWEDPRLDRQALELTETDRLLVITSAGCNALEYALDGLERVDTVDMNPRQNALLNLKIAAIRELDYETFFELFGRGRLANWKEVYSQTLRPALPQAAQEYWDKKGKFFSGKGRRPSFYFRGTSGYFAWSINAYINRIARIRPQIDRLLNAETLEEQQHIFHEEVKSAFWGPGIQWFLRRDATLSLLGVPRAQRRQLEKNYPGGIAKFIEDRLDTVFSKLPLKDNYFWRVYLTGEYTPECCPEYLVKENFERLKGGLVDRVRTHTTTILDHLESTDQTYSRYVLLDHMDWLAENHADILQRQWQAITDHADDQTRLLWRSAALKVDFIDPIEVELGGQTCKLGNILSYNESLAEKLHAVDRVNTYGSFSIATLHKTSHTAATEDNDERTGATKDPLPSGSLSHSG